MAAEGRLSVPCPFPIVAHPCDCHAVWGQTVHRSRAATWAWETLSRNFEKFRNFATLVLATCWSVENGVQSAKGRMCTEIGLPRHRFWRAFCLRWLGQFRHVGHLNLQLFTVVFVRMWELIVTMCVAALSALASKLGKCRSDVGRIGIFTGVWDNQGVKGRRFLEGLGEVELMFVQCQHICSFNVSRVLNY